MDYRYTVGRPLKFKSPEELQKKIDAYFLDCDPHLIEVDDVVKGKAVRLKKLSQQKPYTISGLAVWLDTTRETLLDYKEKPEYSDSLEKAKQKCEQFAENFLFSGKPTAGAQFSLKNNYKKWVDKIEINHNHAISLQDSIKKLELEGIQPDNIIEGEIIQQDRIASNDDENEE